MMSEGQQPFPSAAPRRRQGLQPFPSAALRHRQGPPPFPSAAPRRRPGYLRRPGKDRRPGIPDPSPRSPRRPTCARAGRARCYVRRRSAVTTPGGDVCPSRSPPPHWRGGAWSSPGKRRVGPVLKGTEGDVDPYSRCPKCGFNVLVLQHSEHTNPIITIPAGINRYRRITLLRRFTVSLSRVIAVAPTGLSQDRSQTRLI